MDSERRKFKRFNIPLNVEFKSGRETREYSSGTIINFSRDGFCFESEDVDLKLEGSIELKVKHPYKDIFIPVTGDIVWNEHLETKYLAGIKVAEMDKEAKSEILEYAYDIWLEKKRKQDLSNT